MNEIVSDKPPLQVEYIGETPHSIKDTSLPWIAFYCAYPHEFSSNVVEDLQSIMSLGGYIVSLEIAQGKHLETEGQHYHFLIQCSINDYNSYVKRVLRETYKLRGQCRKGLPKQYGRVKKPLEDVERMGSYVCKDSCIITNLETKDIERMYDASYKKKSEHDLRDEVMDFIDSQYVRSDEWTTDVLSRGFETNINQACGEIKLCIIRFFRGKPEHRMPVRSKLCYYAQYYCMYHKASLFSDEEILHYFY